MHLVNHQLHLTCWMANCWVLLLQIFKDDTLLCFSKVFDDFYCVFWALTAYQRWNMFLQPSSMCSCLAIKKYSTANCLTNCLSDMDSEGHIIEQEWVNRIYPHHTVYKKAL